VGVGEAGLLTLRELTKIFVEKLLHLGEIQDWQLDDGFELASRNF